MTDGFDRWYLETVFVDSKDYTQDPKRTGVMIGRRIIHNDKADYDKSYGWLWDPKKMDSNHQTKIVLQTMKINKFFKRPQK